MSRTRVQITGQGNLFEGVSHEALVPVKATCTECGKPLRSRDGRVSGVGTVCAAKIGRRAILGQEG